MQVIEITPPLDQSCSCLILRRDQEDKLFYFLEQIIESHGTDDIDGLKITIQFVDRPAQEIYETLDDPDDEWMEAFRKAKENGEEIDLPE